MSTLTANTYQPAARTPTPAPLGDFRSILKETETYGTGQKDDAADQLNSWFDTLMIQSGMGVAPSVILMLCLLSALTVGGIVFVIQENFLSTAAAGMLGFFIPIATAMILRGRRQGKIMEQVPPMLEELARAAKTGRSVDQCLQLVANDTPAPLGDEMRVATRRLALGIPVREAFQDLPFRSGLMTLNLLVMTLTVHQQTGGDLVGVLERLSRTVRDRLAYLGRLRAATAASRATATLMMVLPPAILLFFTLRDPQYLNNLFSSSWGRNATLLAGILQVIGIVWVLRILKDSQRT